jgi:LytS/YehU family sensor histidine kinase
MLFIAFVENAFKHGVKRGVNPGIIINLDVSDNKINFEVINYCQRKGESNKDLTGGIGLANIKRRLELLHPNKFTLDILNNEEVYHVKLQINE